MAPRLPKNLLEAISLPSCSPYPYDFFSQSIAGGSTAKDPTKDVHARNLVKVSGNERGFFRAKKCNVRYCVILSKY